MEKQKVRKAVLTDAGYATRFLPITKTLPKSMLPILDKPITHYIVEECMAAGITEIIIVSTEEGRPIYEDYFHNTVQHIHQQLEKQGKEERFRKVSQVFSLPNIIVITQDKNLPYGNGSPALSARPYVGNEPFIYIYTDDLVFGKSRVSEMIEVYENSGDDVFGVIPAKELPGIDVTKYGMIKIKDGTENVLDYIIEKPSPEESPSNLVSFSGYLLKPEIFEYLQPTESNLGKDSELWMVDAIHRMAKEKTVLVKPISGDWKTTGDPVNYLQTSIDFALDNPEYNGKFKEYLKSKLLIN
ncbi:MAG: sugar phosphate nucleotidyltransferase [bacterium]|nr:sugar phosphate nucleotidyltransferase [bacterium]